MVPPALWSQRRIRGFRDRYWGNQARTRSLLSWELESKVPRPKTEESADLVQYFSGVAKFREHKNQTSNVRGSISGLNRIFTREIPQ